MQQISPMKNVKDMSDKELSLKLLNNIAEGFELKLYSLSDFIKHCKSLIAVYVLAQQFDRIEEKLLLEQLEDISNGKYSRFSEPEMPPLEPCGYDEDTKNMTELN